jgi:SAM-dependent methyltransferase
LIVLLSLAVCAAAGASAQESRDEKAKVGAERSATESWDRVFRNKPYLPVQPSGSFVAYCAERSLSQSLLERGSKVLVLAMGDGANAIYLAQQGLDVTGMDISPVAIAKAREAAEAAGVPLRTVEADLFDYDMGRGRWDLVTNIYFNPAIRVMDKLKAAVRPGGLLLIEGFSADHKGQGPPAWSRYRQDQLLDALDGWRILEYQDGLFQTIWAGEKPVPVVRLLAKKPGRESATPDP